jgi:hypothetical protein
MMAGTQQRWIANRGERDERDAVGKVVCRDGRHGEREPGLAHPAGTGQGEQRNVVTEEQIAHHAQLLLPPNERGAWSRQLGGMFGWNRRGHGNSA